MDMDANAEFESNGISIIQHFADLEDPRVGPHILHKLMDILVITICAVIAGCESFLQIAEYGRHKEAWLRNFLELPHGIPSHDTFARVWTVIDPARVTPVPESLRNKELWRDLNSLGMVQSRRIIAGREESDTRYFISSLKPDAQQLAYAVRSHWSIENSLHWVLDVTFREDDCRIRDRYGAQNLATLRRLVIALLKREHTKQSLVTKRMMTGWDDDYMFQVLMAAGKT
jgi:predicted transposase YbfD/YdcC